ncbi:hypothetical protein CPB84DRAFT_1782842, partial [Gymnopilus junonius]
MPYVEGDDLHPKANIEKMANGIALDDADREPWLALIRRTAVEEVEEVLKAKEEEEKAKEEGKERQEQEQEGKKLGVVITCSSLKRYYRDILRGKRKVTSSVPLSKESASAHTTTTTDPEPSSRSKSLHEEMPTYFVFIDGEHGLLMDRMTKRPGHFMKASMLEGQLATLERPVGEEGVVTVDAAWEQEMQVRRAVEGLKTLKAVMKL